MVHLGRRGHIALGNGRLAAEPVPDGHPHRINRHLGCHGGEPTEESGVGDRSPGMPLCHFAGRCRSEAVAPESAEQRDETELFNGARGS